MTTTPPLRSRARTPPTPLYGLQHDTYSPRRSSRLSQQRAKSPTLQTVTSSPSRQTSSKVSKPAVARRQAIRRQDSQTYSPPSSPVSPPTTRKQPAHHRAEVALPTSRHNGTARVLFQEDSDMDGVETTLNVYRGTKVGALDALPTPAKTPRKRHVTGEQAASTARVLFPGRPATVEDAMPTPRKARGTRANRHFTLDSFDEEGDQQAPKITIYTDSKERVPELDDDPDNPFVNRRSTRRSRQASETERRPTRRTKHGMSEEIDRAVENNEGMVYVFRGKKIYRKFDDANPQDTTRNDSQTLVDHEILTRAGAEAHRPLTRSSLKPRVLFPRRDSDADELNDEEAMTDIEPADHVPMETDKPATPTRHHFRPATPPTTGRKAKAKAKEAISSDSSPSGGVPVPADEGPLHYPSMAGRRKSTPFDTWARTKQVRSGTTSAKREGDPIETVDLTASKRSRSRAI